MNKDNLLFAVIGILVGFIAGYLLHEVMAARQPPRLRPGDAAAAMGGAPDGSGEAAGAADAGGAPVAGPGGQGAGSPMAAIQQLREYVEKNPNDADAVLKLANANYDIQRWERAQELYSRYLKLRPAQPDVLTDLGITYRQLGKFQEALDQFAAAQKLAPDHWQSRFNQVVVLGIDLKRYDEAKRILAELEKLQPGNQDVARLAAELDRRSKAAA